jgi:predicted transcriptional regulator
MSWWILGILGVAVVVGILYDTWRYNQNTGRLIELLEKRGPMTGLEISKAGVSRSHTYLILARLEHKGIVAKFPAPDPQYGGQFKYMLVK